MPQGMECWDASGKQTFSTNTMTTRIFGQRVAGPPYYERFIVPVSPGKRLWFYHYVRGSVSAYMFLDGYVDTSLNVPNRVTLQVDSGGTGEAYFFWGEY